MLICNARIYNVCDATDRLWRRFFADVATFADLDLVYRHHETDLETLWRNERLGLVLMCGRPFMAHGATHHLIGAAVPVFERYGGRPIYHSDYVVRAESPYQSLVDAFDGTLGWLVEHSHSGFNAPRHDFLRYRGDRDQTLFRASVGPLGTPKNCLAAVRDGVVDIVPVDSVYLDLLKRHLPDTLAGLRVVGQTQASPIPPLVGGPALTAAEVDRLRNVVLSYHRQPDGRDLLERIGWSRFAPVTAAEYATVATKEHEALAANYPRPA